MRMQARMPCCPLPLPRLLQPRDDDDDCDCDGSMDDGDGGLGSGDLDKSADGNDYYYLAHLERDYWQPLVGLFH